MIVVFSILSPRAFPTLGNFTNVLNQASLAVIIGELDLSIQPGAGLVSVGSVDLR